MSENNDALGSTDADPEGSHSRRAFLKWGGGFATGVGASWVAAQIPAVRAQTTLPGFCGTQPAEPDDEVGLILGKLFSSGADVRCHAGSAHYQVGGVHSDNAIVQREFVDLVGSVAAVSTEEARSRAFELSPNTDWILIGGPHSSTAADNLLRKSEDAATGLRFTYETDNQLVTLKRYSAGGDLLEFSRRSWIRDWKYDNVYRPDEGEWLDNDYLLITRLSERIGGATRYRTIVGGTHGLGTRAVAELLKTGALDAGVRRKIDEAAGGTLQILAKVTATHGGGKTVLGAVTVHEVFAT